MSIALNEPDLEGLSAAIDVLREWQYDGAPIQLHPGDLGWYWRFGAAVTARAVRTWSRDGRVLAVGLLDGPQLLRLAIAPDGRDDEHLVRAMVVDVSSPERGVLPGGTASVEARFGGPFTARLLEEGWVEDESWTPLCRDLAEPVEDRGVRIEVIGPEQVSVRTSVQRAAFDGSTFTDERWRAMAAGPAYPDARCLIAFDERDQAVAAATVWSAGAGRPGLLEPMGVHRDHRGHGYGTAITLGAAAALRELGSSSATVCTASSNVGAVATYASAGFQRSGDVRDLRRGA